MPREADKPLILCYDGSEPAKHALTAAAPLLAPAPALVVATRSARPW